MNDAGATIAVLIRVQGVVQGVGFRPFVYRLAKRHAINGWVANTAEGVVVHAEGAPGRIAAFVRGIGAEAPPAAVIARLETEPVRVVGAATFEIRESMRGAAPTVRISPDLAVCPDCLRELRDAADPRGAYPYINCTNCGPRYSIIRRLPYDRINTTMAPWELCSVCTAQYSDPDDRRFHAQPVACPRCGPSYYLQEGQGEGVVRGPEAVRRAIERLQWGALVAVKGIGGYHIACDANNARSVELLRTRKFRKEQPFALMARSLDEARRIVDLGPGHDALLTSVARPIVLAPARQELPGIAPDRRELGVMLPYAPLHHMLFDGGAPSPLVMTSANRSSEPIAFEDDDAIARLTGIADALLIGERPIARRVDDSVATVRCGQPFMIRRSRGYAPSPVASLPTEAPILGVGGDLKNAVAVVVGGEVHVSQHIGDLEQRDTRGAFRQTIDDLLEMYDVDRSRLVIAHDLHPEYASTLAAREMRAARHVAVQHHEAHFASVLAEHGAPETPAIGVILDGTGYGPDGAIWGGEFFTGCLVGGFERCAHWDYVPMPGGDAAARWPVQAAAGYLAQADDAPQVMAPPFSFPSRYRRAAALIRSETRCFATSSTGRLFDTAAALLGFVREATYEAQAPAWLESLANDAPEELAAYETPRGNPPALLLAMARERLAGVNRSDVARRFHATLVEWVVATVRELSRRTGARHVVLSGGAFQNSLLLQGVHQRLAPEATVLTNRRVPVNDGGICLGQVAMAAYGPGAGATGPSDAAVAS